MGRALSRELRGADTVGSREFIAAPKRATASAATWILAVKDADIQATAAALLGVAREGDVVLHLAGMLGPEVLAPLREVGAQVASMHPLCAVNAMSRPGVLRGAVFFAEGDPGSYAELRRVVEALHGTLLCGEVTDRAAYHGGAALLATGAVALAQGAQTLWTRAMGSQLGVMEMNKAVASLLRSVAVAIETAGVYTALASPLLRDDTATVALHLDAMADSPAVRALYSAAVALVLDAIEAQGQARPETISEARRLTRAVTSELEPRRVRRPSSP